MNQVGEIFQLMHDLTLASGDKHELHKNKYKKFRVLALVQIAKLLGNHGHIIHKHCRKY